MMFVQHNHPKGCSKGKKTFHPKRLRKQLDTAEFKQFYFELVPSINNNATSSTTTLLKREPDANSDSDQYKLMSFQCEASEQEKMRRAIHQCSSHFHVASYMHHSKRKKLKSNACVDLTCSSPIASSASSDISTIFSHHSSSNSTNSVIQKKSVSSFNSLQSNIIIISNQTNSIATQQTSSSPSTCSSGFMLSLDYESITDLLLDENSPFNNLLKAPIFERQTLNKL